MLAGLKVVQLGAGTAAAVCGRLLAELGATVTCIDAKLDSPLLVYLNHDKARALEPAAQRQALAEADLIVREIARGPGAVHPCGKHELRGVNPRAALVTLSAYGESGPQAEHPASDLTLFFASGIARLLNGQVDDLAEAPVRPVGNQSAFLGGLAAACAGMNAALCEPNGVEIDVSIHEVLATLAITELARAGLHGKSWSRKRVADGNGATVTVLPARDGYTAISPREEKQWAAWLSVMGSPEWGTEPRFRTKPDRVRHWDELHALMSSWSRGHDKPWIADAAQTAHVPSFALREVGEQLDTPQLAHRHFYRALDIGGRSVRVPGSPFGIHIAAAQPLGCARSAALPLQGVRVLDFSWVIAGPTTTRYLAALGAEVIKVEAPGSGDPGRASELHTVLGQAKQAIVLDLKKPQGLEIARALAAKSDILIENYATGVMDRLGLGAETLRSFNPGLIYISASGMGRTGPESRAVAYGTLLQGYAGFAGLNRHADRPPRTGLAWLDPMCALMLAFIAGAAVWQRRRHGGVARIDFSMVEAMLWTMAKPLLDTQLSGPPRPAANRSACYAPHGVWRCAGDDDWIGIAVRSDAEWQALCGVVPALAPHAALGIEERLERGRMIDAAIAAWAVAQRAETLASVLVRSGVPAAALARSADLVRSAHLAARGFWDEHAGGVLPGLPWRASFGRGTGPAPALGADTERVLQKVLNLSPDAVAALRASGALG